MLNNQPINETEAVLIAENDLTEEKDILINIDLIIQIKLIISLGKFITFISLFLSKMNYAYDLWDISPSEHSFGSARFYYESESYSFNPVHHEHQKANKQQPNVRLLIERCQTKKPTILLRSNQNASNSYIQKKVNYQQNSKGKKKIKPSPYHNYQKHLNTTLKHLIILPVTEGDIPNQIHIAEKLWSIFYQNQSFTKKILHFIFNEFNEYRIKQNEIQKFGFKQIYSETSKQILGGAKNYLTNITLNQLNDQNIDNYLETRRIKNPQKFKRYLMVFRKELQDGFLKKRFTNRNRKQQRRKQFNNRNQ